MKLTENLDAHISAYEQETGAVIKPEVLELIKAMAAAGDHFEAIGKKMLVAGMIRGQKMILSNGASGSLQIRKVKTILSWI